MRTERKKSMNELKEKIMEAAIQELNRANERFPLFISKHEGYAVIKEKMEETSEALETLQDYIGTIWEHVRGKQDRSIGIDTITKQAINTACAATQTAAMLMKYSMSIQKEN